MLLVFDIGSCRRRQQCSRQKHPQNAFARNIFKEVSKHNQTDSFEVQLKLLKVVMLRRRNLYLKPKLVGCKLAKVDDTFDATSYFDFDK